MGCEIITDVKKNRFRFSQYLVGKKRAFKSKCINTIKKNKRGNSDSSSDFDNSKKSISRIKIEELIPWCGRVDDYECLDSISHGAYGAVYRARHLATGAIVAVKKEFDGLSPSTLAEINILRSLRHPSVVEYKQVVVGGDDHDDAVYVVMEYAEHDLHEYIRDTEGPFALGRVKCLMKEFLEGVEYLHVACRVMHRDLKPSNILINALGELKICDFGMSRRLPTALDPLCTTRVGTLWYRAPELLLGEFEYSAAVDMWSVGCVMAEFFLREVLFRGESELQQLNIITTVVRQPSNCLRDKLDAATTLRGGPVLTEAGFDLLCQLLAYDPEQRITAQNALNHDWFQESSS